MHTCWETEGKTGAITTTILTKIVFRLMKLMGVGVLGPFFRLVLLLSLSPPSWACCAISFQILFLQNTIQVFTPIFQSLGDPLEKVLLFWLLWWWWCGVEEDWQMGSGITLPPSWLIDLTGEGLILESTRGVSESCCSSFSPSRTSSFCDRNYFFLLETCHGESCVSLLIRFYWDLLWEFLPCPTHFLFSALSPNSFLLTRFLDRKGTISELGKKSPSLIFCIVSAALWEFFRWVH